jgi:serine/threonine protein kinase
MMMEAQTALVIKAAQSQAQSRLRAEIRSLFGRSAGVEPTPVHPWIASRYQLLKTLGAGARATVHLARDTWADRLIAIKILHAYPDHGSRQRFLREAECAGALIHPNIVRMYDVGRDGVIDFIVMEYVPGRTLDQLISERGLLLSTALDCALQMGKAIAAVHAVGLMHRDLKPSNFVITKSGVIKMLDFGLVKVVSRWRGRRWSRNSRRPETRDGAILGTAGYMSPEQVRGQFADRRSDIFSFGAVFYEMLTGRRAFQERNELETMHATVEKPARTLPAHIPAPIARVAERCLAKDPKQRYPTGAQLTADLVRVSGVIPPPSHGRQQRPAP